MNIIKKLSDVALLLCFFIIFGSDSISASENKTIQIVTPAWENQTNEDGTGFFFDIMRSVYEPVGIKLQYEIVPWKRAKHLVASGKADAMLCVAEQNIGKQLVPKYPMIVDYTSVVFKKDRIKEWKGVETLDGKYAIWRLGYDFHMNPKMKGVRLKGWKEFHDYNHAWNLLKNNRTDFYIDALIEIQSYIKNNNIDMSSFQTENVWGEKMYISFAVSEKSEKLIRIYDRRIVGLAKSGELKIVFDKWGLYPFEAHLWE